jgi:hypothetical protein
MRSACIACLLSFAALAGCGGGDADTVGSADASTPAPMPATSACEPAQARSWRIPVQLGPTYDASNEVELFMDDAANAMAVAVAPDFLPAVQFFGAASRSWGPPSALPALSNQGVGVGGMIGSGDATVLTSTAQGLFAQRYRAASAQWGSPVLVASTPASATTFPGVGVGTDGARSLLAVWYYDDPTANARTLSSAFYDTASDIWSPPVVVQTTGLDSAPDFGAITVNRQGDAAIVADLWDRAAGASFEVGKLQVVRWSHGDRAWQSSLTDIPGATDVERGTYGASLADDGSLFVAYFRPAEAAVYVVRGTATTWDAPVTLWAGQYSTSRSGPHVATAGSRGVVSMWWPSTTTGSPTPVARFEPAAGWMQVPAPAPPLVPSNLPLAIDAAGNLFSPYFFDENGAPVKVGAIRFDAAANRWDPPVTFAAAPPNATEPSIRAAPCGRALAVWIRCGASSGIRGQPPQGCTQWASTFE